MIEKLNVGRLIRYMVAPDDRRDEPVRDWRPAYPPLLDDEPLEGEPRVAHIGHIEDAESMLLVEPSLAELPEPDREELLMRFVKVAKPAVGQRLRIRSEAGSTVHLTVIGMLLTSSMVERLMRSGEREMVIERVDEAISLARSLGCEIVGLGGYTSIVTLNCTAVARPDAALTSGNAFTAALGLEGIEACLAERGLSLSDARVGVVGAKGNIGSICARILAEDAREIVLVGRDAKDPGLLAVAEAITADARKTDPARAPFVHVTDDMHELRGCDVILSSSNASMPVIHAKHLSPRVQVICDIATPRDVAPDVAPAFPGLTILSGGLARLPEARGLRLLGTRLPDDHIFGCVAETALLGLHGHKSSFSFGAISPEQVKFIQQLGRLHGFRLGRAQEGGAP
jgi:predicted amino acid dehydrogenase